MAGRGRCLHVDHQIAAAIYIYNARCGWHVALVGRVRTATGPSNPTADRKDQVVGRISQIIVLARCVARQQRRAFGRALVALVLRLFVFGVGDARHDHLALADRTVAPVLGQPRIDALQMISVAACRESSGG